MRSVKENWIKYTVYYNEPYKHFFVEALPVELFDGSVNIGEEMIKKGLLMNAKVSLDSFEISFSS